MSLILDTLYDSFDCHGDALLSEVGVFRSPLSYGLVVVDPSANLNLLLTKLQSMVASGVDADELQDFFMTATWDGLVGACVHDFSTDIGYVIERKPCVVRYHLDRLTPLHGTTTSPYGSVSVSSFHAQEGDCLVLFRDRCLYEDIGANLTLGWKRDFGLNSLMKLMHQSPCTRWLLADIFARMRTYRKALTHTQPDHSPLDGLVVVIRYMRAKHATILVGPPSDPTMDCHVVDLLMEREGYKFVCGGTTSELVSRCLDRPVIEIPNYGIADIPPISMIQGIDLVTEGVLTLRKVREFLSILNNIHSLVLTYHEQYQHDGAFLLTKVICAECSSIQFLVGTACNPAHQDMEKIATESKLSLVRACKQELEKMGKQVSIQYF